MSSLYFYPRSPCGERRPGLVRHGVGIAISIHALLAESDIAGPVPRSGRIISIHALLAESDCIEANKICKFPIISIHALLAESDPITKKPPLIVSAFLSTLSLRRATQCRTLASGMYGFLSTLSLRRATPSSKTGRRFPYFYPRSPCGERPKELTLAAKNAVFLSTLSLRRATRRHQKQDGVFRISIHALLAESDVVMEATKVENQ